MVRRKHWTWRPVNSLIARRISFAVPVTKQQVHESIVKHKGMLPAMIWARG